jgi:hypothetical protein
MWLEGVLDVTDAGLALAKEDPYDVEPHGVEGWLSIEEVEFGKGADLGLFMRGDGLQRVSEAGSAAQFHLDEDEHDGSNVQNTMTPEFRFRAPSGDGTLDVCFKRA